MDSRDESDLCYSRNLAFSEANVLYILQAKEGLTLSMVLYRAFTILTGFGLSMNGKHIYCGDYIYSGHTMTIVLAHLLIQVRNLVKTGNILYSLKFGDFI